MKFLLKLILSFVVCIILSSASYANNSKYFVAEKLAYDIKISYLNKYGAFPIKIDDITYLINLTSDKQNIVFDYKVTKPSDEIPLNEIVEYLTASLKISICSQAATITFLHENELSLSFNYQLSDNKTVSVTLAADDICD